MFRVSVTFQAILGEWVFFETTFEFGLCLIAQGTEPGGDF